MIWLRLQMAVLVIALIAASTQCLAQCVAQPCHAVVAADESVPPPCHRHTAPKQTDTQESCKRLVLVSDYRVPSVVSVDLQRLDFAGGLTGPSLLAAACGGDPLLQLLSPPRSAIRSLFSVLRV